MTNPYEATKQDPSGVKLPRHVRTFVFAGVAIVLIAVLIALPGLYLLNFDLQIIPTATAHYITAINGIPVSNTVIIRFLLTVSCYLVFIPAVFWGFAVRNYHYNSRLATLREIACPGKRHGNAEGPTNTA